MKRTRRAFAQRPARLALLLVTCCLLAAALTPAPAAGVNCCTYSYTVTYYSDATYQTVVGRCVYNEACTSDVVCTGTTSPYQTTSHMTCCLRCGL